VYVDGGTFTISGEARVNTNNPVCLVYTGFYSFGTVLTIGGNFTGTGTLAKIDLLSFSNPNPANDWAGRAVLALDGSYSGSGNLSTLRNRFVLGNFVYARMDLTNTPTSTPITGYEIGADGKLQPTP
jgi:hypothetical protein